VEKLNIIQIADKLNAGAGVPNFVFDLCAALRSAGNQVTLIGLLENTAEVPDQIKELEEAGVSVIQLGGKSKKDAILHDVPRLRKVIRERAGEEPTICNLHLKVSVLMGALATIGLKNVKCVETYHNMYHHYHLEHYVLMPRIKKYVTVSETAREEMFRRFHTPKRKVVAAPNGIDVKETRRIAGAASAERDEKVITVTTVARLSYEKNVGAPIEAFRELCNERLRYVIIGDGPQRDELRAKATNEYVEFKGYRPREEVLSSLANSDLVVLPSLWEGRSILMMEAMALGRPMMIADAPGIREPFAEPALREDELYRRSKFGYLVRTKEIKSYQAALRDFVEHPELHEKMMNYVYEKSEACDVSIMLSKYVETYKTVLDIKA